MITPRALRCEYLPDPLGLGTAAPRFTWQLTAPERGVEQSAYQILVATSPDLLLAGAGDLWDSGKVVASNILHALYAGRTLYSRERARWTVRCWDEHGEVGPYAAPASFEMGLLEAQDWSAQWIGADDPSCESPLFRTTFVLDRPVARARAYVCGLGYYELRLNGAKVGDHVLDPNWTDFDQRELRDLLYPFADGTRKRVHSITYDLTDTLRPGENAVGLWLGNGWYNQHARNIEGQMAYGPPRGLVQVEVTHTDGTRAIIATDDSWRWAPSPILCNSLHFGETYDARREQPGWDAPGFDDGHWQTAANVRPPSGALHAQTSPPDKIMQTLAPIRRSEPQPGVYVFDFGQNSSGWVRLRVQGPTGTALRLRFAEELLPDGNLDFASTGGNDQIQEDTYVLRGEGEEVYAPRFTWHGFRYAELTGYPGEPSPEAVSYEVVHSSVGEAGHFRCSNDLLNRLYQIYRETQLANYHGATPSDCPHRERIAYTCDGHLTAESAMCCFDVAAFYEKWLHDIADAQHPVTGFVPHSAPFYGGGGGPAWGAAYPIVAWLHYQYYGDLRVLKQHYDGLQAWLRYLDGCTDPRGLVVREEPGSWNLGDWSLPGEPGFLENPALRPELVSTAYAGLSARLLARISQALGEEAAARAATARADSFAQALHSVFYDPEQGCYRPGRNGAEAFAWACGAIPESELPRVAEHVLRHLSSLGNHLDTGILGTPLLLDFLTATGHGEVAYQLMTQTTEPSFGHMLARGATTLWENWARENGSHCHPMYGSVIAWMVKTLAGLQVDRPGFAKMRIHPHPLGDLTQAEASLETVRGLAAVHWHRTDDAFTLQITIPQGTTAAVTIPTDDPTTAHLYEGARLLWAQGTQTDTAPGIAAMQATANAILLELRGGEYRFGLGNSGGKRGV